MQQNSNNHIFTNSVDKSNNLIDKHWASIWGNAVSIGENRPESYGKNITFRYPIYSQFSGEGMKLTFDNYCGTEPITISECSVYVNGEFYDVTFENGSKSVTIPAKKNIVSDPLMCKIEAKSQFDVNFYLKDFTQMRSTVYVSGPLSNSAIYAIGNQTHNRDISIDIKRGTNLYYFLSNISILTDKENRTVLCYGDSITAQDWPDYLQLRCKENNFNNTAVIRRATSGSRILREYSCIRYESYGLKGTNRFAHEVPTEGVDTVIIQQGINDIIHPVGTDVNPYRPMSDLPTVDEMIDGMKYYINLAKSYNYKVYVGTLLPIENWRTYADFREQMKNELNDWIRKAECFDGCIDFEKAVRDSKNPKAFAEGMDSGDHLHPSGLGYKTMAECVPDIILK